MRRIHVIKLLDTVQPSDSNTSYLYTTCIRLRLVSPHNLQALRTTLQLTDLAMNLHEF